MMSCRIYSVQNNKKRTLYTEAFWVNLRFFGTNNRNSKTGQCVSEGGARQGRHLIGHRVISGREGRSAYLALRPAPYVERPRVITFHKAG